MSLTKEQGYIIRERNSGELERQICEKYDLKQIGGSHTKIDGSNSNYRMSIKNFSGNSTQVHLTTKKHFIDTMKVDDLSSKFINLFCGDKDTNNNGKDRYSINEIDSKYLDAFNKFLKENTEKIVNLLISGSDDITHIIYRNTKTDSILELTYQEVIDKVKVCEWVFLSGGIHLKNPEGRTYFHFQREGKKKISNRYNVLWHIPVSYTHLTLPTNREV